MKEKGNIFGGMVLLMGAVALIANRLGFLEGVGFWTILLNICLLSILIQGIFRRKVGTTLFSAAIGDDREVIEDIYGDSFLNISDLRTMPQKLAALLLRYIR